MKYLRYRLDTVSKNGLYRHPNHGGLKACARVSRGFAALTVIIAIGVVTVASVATTVSIRFIQQQQNITGKAAVAEPCKICQNKTCATIASPPSCSHNYNECSNNTDCGAATPPTATPQPQWYSRCQGVVCVSSTDPHGTPCSTTADCMPPTSPPQPTKPPPTNTPAPVYTCTNSSGNTCNYGVSHCGLLNKQPGVGTCPPSAVCCGASIPPSNTPRPLLTNTPPPSYTCVNTAGNTCNYGVSHCGLLGKLSGSGTCPPSAVCCGASIPPTNTPRPLPTPTVAPVYTCTHTTGYTCNYGVSHCGLLNKLPGAGTCPPSGICCSPQNVPTIAPLPTLTPTLCATGSYTCEGTDSLYCFNATSAPTRTTCTYGCESGKCKAAPTPAPTSTPTCIVNGNTCNYGVSHCGLLGKLSGSGTCPPSAICCSNQHLPTPAPIDILASQPANIPAPSVQPTRSPNIQVMDESQTCGLTIGSQSFECRSGFTCAFNKCIKEVNDCYCQNVCGSGTCSMKTKSQKSGNDIQCAPSYCNYQEQACATDYGTFNSGETVCDINDRMNITQCKDGALYSIPCQLGKQCVGASRVTGKPACEFTSQQADAVKPYSSNPAFLVPGYLQSAAGQKDPFPLLNTQRYFDKTFGIKLPSDQNTGEKYDYSNQTVQNLAWIYHNFGKPQEMIDDTYAYIYDSPRQYEMLTEFVNPLTVPDVNVDDFTLLSQLVGVPRQKYPYSHKYLNLWEQIDRLEAQQTDYASSLVSSFKDTESEYYSATYGYTNPNYRVASVFDEALNICGNFADYGVWMNAQVSDVNVLRVNVANTYESPMGANPHALLAFEYDQKLYAHDYTWGVVKPLSHYLNDYYPDADLRIDTHNDPRPLSNTNLGQMNLGAMNPYFQSLPSLPYPVSNEAYYSTLEDMGEYLPRYDHACTESGWIVPDKKYGPLTLPWTSACIRCDQQGRALREADPTMCLSCSQRDKSACHSNCNWLMCSRNESDGACYDAATPIEQICGEESCESRSSDQCMGECSFYWCANDGKGMCYLNGTDQNKVCP